MACYLPGASTLDEFWALLAEGREAMRPVTEEALEASGVPEREFNRSDYVRVAAVLDGADEFDPGFFRLSPNDAKLMDPQHRKFLECVWEALEHAGVTPGGAESVGVFAGSGMDWYYFHNLGRNPELVDRLGHFVLRHTANDKDFLATRVSYQFDLRGPSVNVQTACSTSLVAIHQACQSLINHECDVAIAGGTTIDVPHGAGYRYREGEVQSPDGHCRPFDADAAGTVFGSGCAAVVLRRLDDAVEAGHTIHAQIIGSAINNDGARKVGYMAPSLDGHADVVQEALELAEVDPQSITLIEAHGTATRLGDPIEVAAFQQAFGSQNVNAPWCGVGSVKGNIGHLDTAAGIASFLKVVLALRNKAIPPSLHFRQINPEIHLDGSPFYIADRFREWLPPPGTPRRAGVSSLGVGGTNAHVVLEEWEDRPAPVAPIAEHELFIWSARSAKALADVMQRTATLLEKHPDISLSDVAHTLRWGRAAFEQRAYVVAGDRRQLIDALRATPGVQRAKAPGDVAFLFPGQGAQYPGMAAGLYEDATFRSAFDRCADLIERAGGPDIRLAVASHLVGDEDANRRLRQTSVAQPALFAVEYALAQTLRHYGIQPSYMIGHSIGEYAAACIAGVLSVEDAVELVVQRGELMQSMAPGVMVAVLTAEDEVRRLVPDDLDIAAVNAPESVVVAGHQAAVDGFAATLAERGIGCRPLHTSHAFHSRSMDDAIEPFVAAVAQRRLAPPSIPYIANVTGDWATAADVTDPVYWGRHIRQPVRFADGIEAILKRQPAVLVEVGPGTTLSRLVAAAGGSSPSASVSTIPAPDAVADARRHFVRSIGEIWSRGGGANWNAFGGKGRRRIPLPTYAFQRTRLWIDPPVESARAQQQPDRLERMPLDDWFYAPYWQPAPRPRVFPERKIERAWVISDGASVFDEVARRLRVRGAETTVLTMADANPPGQHVKTLSAGSGADFERCIDELGYPSAVVLGSAYDADLLPREEGAEIRRSFDTAVSLLQALHARSAGDAVDVLMVTKDLLPVSGAGVRAAGRATLIGPCRVAPVEHPEFRVRLIDLDGAVTDDDACDRMLSELSVETPVPITAYRGRVRMTPSVTPVKVSETSPASDARAVCIVTGAFGGLGREVSRWLAQTRAERLVLLVRSGTEAGADAWSRRAFVQDLADLGVQVDVHVADISDASAVQSVVRQTVECAGRVDEVYHLAGTLDDGLLARKDLSAMQRVLAPKVAGTLALDSALRAEGQRPVVVLFSSASAHIGVVGQIDYAAANAFLDTWAYADHQGGPRYRVIDWGMWSEVGMAAALDRDMAVGNELPAAPLPIAHPTLHSWGTREDGARVFWGDIAATDHWTLRDHRLRASGEAVLPGTAYIDLMLTAHRAVEGDGPVELRDVTFSEPMLFSGSARRRLILTMRKRDSGWAVSVESVGGRTDRRLHVEAMVCVARAHVSDPLAPADADPLPWVAADHPLLRFGQRWAELDARVFRRGGTTRNDVRLPDRFAEDLQHHIWHPAMTDVAIGAGIADTLGEGSHPLIPFSYQRLVVHRAIGPAVTSLMTVRQDGSPAEVVVDGSLYDDQGCVARIEGYVLRPVPKALQADGSVAASVPAHRRTGSVTDLGMALAIRPEEGMQALGRICATEDLPQVVVSPIPFTVLEAALGEMADVDHPQPGEDGEEDRAPRPDVSAAYAAPGSEVEEKIAELWAGQLGIERVGLDDDFFELGGHSLLLTRILQTARRDHEYTISMNDAFDRPTVRRWATAASESHPDDDARAVRRVDRSRFRVAVADMGEVM
jgi:acyl transferase domain-containing protein